jgi:Uma2 family endonuclease
MRLGALMTELVHIRGWLPIGRLSAAHMPDIDLDAHFEISAGRLEIMVPPSPWHQDAIRQVERILAGRFPYVTGGVTVVAGENGRRPDVVALSVPREALLRDRLKSLRPDMLRGAVEVISHADDPKEDAESVARDREDKFREYAAVGIPEYWIVDETPDDPTDAIVEIFHLRDGRYAQVLEARLSQLTAGAVSPPTR